MKEIWKDVVDYEGFYKISNLGRVRRLSIFIMHKSGYLAYKKGGFMKLSVFKKGKNKGYQYLSLCKNGQAKTITFHRLLMQAFVPNPENKPCVNHKNGIKSDNRLLNLEWATYSENNKHAYDSGIKQPPNKGRFNLNGKAVNQYTKNCLFIRSFDSIREAERITGINQCCIGDAIRGIRQKNAGGYKWKYKTKIK